MTANTKYIAIAIGVAVAIAAAVAAASMSGMENDTMPELAEPEPTAPDVVEDDAGLSGVIRYGVLLPATGDLASHGSDNLLGVQLAAMDFNEYLESEGHDWRVELVIEDTQTDPVIALEKLQSINSKGISFVLGPETSSEVRNLKSYADSNNMILISPSSTSPKVAFPDNIFRFVPDDTKQGKVAAALLTHLGKDVVIPIYRGDVWGDGLHESARDSFEAMGGIVDEGIRYNPEITVFSTEASLLDGIVGGYLEEYPPEKVAVMAIGFSEIVHLFNSASSYDTLSSIDWIGSDASALDDRITEDPLAQGFSESTRFISPQFAPSDNEKFQRVTEYLISETGSSPNAYAYSAYDTLWVLGLTMLELNSDQPLEIRDSLHEVGASYTGAIGQVILNEAGDLANADYELWQVVDGEWQKYGKYSAATGEITAP